MANYHYCITIFYLGLKRLRSLWRADWETRCPSFPFSFLGLSGRQDNIWLFGRWSWMYTKLSQMTWTTQRGWLASRHWLVPLFICLIDGRRLCWAVSCPPSTVLRSLCKSSCHPFGDKWTSVSMVQCVHGVGRWDSQGSRSSAGNPQFLGSVLLLLASAAVYCNSCQQSGLRWRPFFLHV